MTKHTPSVENAADLKRRLRKVEAERDFYRKKWLEATAPKNPRKKRRGPKNKKNLILSHVLAGMSYLGLRDPAVRNNSSKIARLLSDSKYAKSKKIKKLRARSSSSISRSSHQSRHRQLRRSWP